VDSTGRPALDALLRYAREHSPYYRELLARHRPFVEVPPLTKSLVRAEFDRILVPGLPPERAVRRQTSGSTGEPAEFVTDDWAGAAAQSARDWLLDLDGIPRDATIVYVILGTPPRLPPNWKPLSMRDTTRENLPDRLRPLGGLGPYFLYGAASSLEWIAAEADRAPDALPDPGPLAVVTSADTLTPLGRERIGRVFGCPVHSWYGSIETDPSLAGTIPGEGDRYAVNEQRSLIEVADEEGRPCPPGERGQILVTDLHNRCFPLIRYAIGDLAVAGEQTYRGSPTLERIEGRSTAVVELASGVQVTESSASRAVLRAPAAARAIDGFQFQQTGPGSLEARVVWRDGPDVNAAAQLEASCLHQWGGDCRVTVRGVERLESMPSGKRWVLRGLPDQASWISPETSRTNPNTRQATAVTPRR
jgi:phenylacetate-CoA ligase